MNIFKKNRSVDEILQSITTAMAELVSLTEAKAEESEEILAQIEDLYVKQASACAESNRAAELHKRLSDLIGG